MMEWVTTANGVLTLVTGLVGLIGTGIGAFFAIKNWVTILKTKKFSEIWSLITTAADDAMTEAEKSSLAGADKKQVVIDTVKAACNTAGVDLGPFLDQLSAYIDESIAFVNGMKNN